MALSNKHYFWGTMVLVALGTGVLIMEFVTIWYVYKALEMSSYILTRGM